jgi:hypothetical protein
VSQPIPAPGAAPLPQRKPALSAREKWGALIAGGVGFLLLTLGFGLFMIPSALLLFGAFFALILGLVRRANDDPDLGGFSDFIERIDPGAWILPLVIIAVVGIATMAVALFVSAGILRSRGVRSPWGVTWAGAGISIVGSWVVSTVLSIPFQFVGAFRGDDSTFGGPFAFIALGFGALVSIAVTAAVGAAGWWWMAHLMRPAVRA